ncbi:hypothetical protein FWK35_00033796 [Aphis craccivora]|uniref:Uncharacterized protein n=1 Tax=Aphis craccivora TaxID=307492 RepID=A0A6G0XXA7_APHCR|nr:hypothetical protein FWK35_00033796 [Aphis craccivora]
MMCVFFLCLSPRSGAESESSWYFGGGVKSKKFPIVFKSVKKNPKKILSGAMNVLILLILQCCMFFFFVSVYTRKCRNNASTSNYGGGFL